MRRFYIAPITNTQPYQPDIPAAPHWTCVIPSKADGTPKKNWCLVLVSGSQAVQDAVDAAQGVRAIPIDKDNMNDVVGNHLGDAPWGQILNKLSQVGVDTSDLNKDQTTLRQLIRKIGRFLDTNFNEDHLNVP